MIKRPTELYNAMHEYVLINRVYDEKYDTPVSLLYAFALYTPDGFMVCFNKCSVVASPCWLYYQVNIFIGTYRQHTYQHVSY